MQNYLAYKDCITAKYMVYALGIYKLIHSYFQCVKFHPNCNYIATGGADRVVRLWSVHDGQSVRLFQGHKAGIFALAFSHDGKLLASAGTGSIKICLKTFV